MAGLVGVNYLAPKIRLREKLTGEILYEQKYPKLWYHEGKEERRTKSKFSHSFFSTVRRINETLGVH